MAFWVVIVPLPIAFIVPVRGDASLYLLLFGWAMIFAKVMFDLIALVSKSLVLLGNRALPAATGAITRNVSTKASLRGGFRIVATLLVAFALAAFTQKENQRLRVPWLNVGGNTSHVIHTVRSLNLRPLHGSSILLLMKDNLFQNKWNVFFIASLVWNDHSLRIWVENVNELTAQQKADVDYIISVSEFEADVVRSPDLQKSE
jgi:hypothetical protein